MEVVLVVMRVIRAEMRLRGGRFASVPQLRALGLVHRRPGASLTDVAAHLGVTPATASVLVDRLVRRGLLHRDAHPRERRRISLSLTREGSRHLRAARTATRRRLAEVLGGLPAPDRATISAGVSLLRHAFRSREGVEGLRHARGTAGRERAPARSRPRMWIASGPSEELRPRW